MEKFKKEASKEYLPPFAHRDGSNKCFSKEMLEEIVQQLR